MWLWLPRDAVPLVVDARRGVVPVPQERVAAGVARETFWAWQRVLPLLWVMFLLLLQQSSDWEVAAAVRLLPPWEEAAANASPILPRRRKYLLSMDRKKLMFVTTELQLLLQLL